MLPEEEYDPLQALRAARRRRPDPERDIEAEFSFTIRDATPQDLPYLRAIYNYYVANSTVTFDEAPLSHQAMRAKFTRVRAAGYPWIVAVSASGEVLGYANVSAYRDKSAYRFTVEDSIYLGPAATGKGVGKALLGELIARSKAAGLKEIVAVIADKGAEASVALHERFGFTEIGRMGKVGFKFGRWLGTIYMQRSLRH
jgi:phosphinothricin acetyltransferase